MQAVSLASQVAAAMGRALPEDGSLPGP